MLDPHLSHPPLPPTLMQEPCLWLNLSRDNHVLERFDVADAAAFSSYVQEQVAQAGCSWAAGGYAEDRALYAMSPLFGGAGNPRSVHLGVDLWMPAGTPVHAVAHARVHSFADNARFGDYGPTIILEHPAQAIFSLYGHLARRSLPGLQVGQTVKAGDVIGWLGAADENLGWSPHLHFQLLRDPAGCHGDYPGVAEKTDAADWLARCPSPEPLLQAWCGPRQPHRISHPGTHGEL